MFIFASRRAFRFQPRSPNYYSALSSVRKASSTPLSWPTSKRPTPFEIFNIDESPNVDEKALRSAFVQLAKQYHPDRVRDSPSAKEAADRFRLVKDAYELLKDDQKRKMYLQTGSGWPYPPKKFQRQYSGMNSNPFAGGPFTGGSFSNGPQKPFDYPLNEYEYAEQLRFARERQKYQSMRQQNPFFSAEYGPNGFHFYPFGNNHSQRNNSWDWQSSQNYSNPFDDARYQYYNRQKSQYNQHSDRQRNNNTNSKQHQPGWSGQGQHTTNGRFAVYVAVGVFLFSPLLSYAHLKLAEKSGKNDYPQPLPISEPDAQRHVNAMQRLRRTNDDGSLISHQQQLQHEQIQRSGQQQQQHIRINDGQSYNYTSDPSSVKQQSDSPTNYPYSTHHDSNQHFSSPENYGAQRNPQPGHPEFLQDPYAHQTYSDGTDMYQFSTSDSYSNQNDSH